MSDHCYPGTAPTATNDPFAVLWVWGTDPSLATRFDTWQDAVLALEHAPPRPRDVHADPDEDGRWLVSSRGDLRNFEVGDRLYLIPDAVAFPRTAPA